MADGWYLFCSIYLLNAQGGEVGSLVDFLCERTLAACASYRDEPLDLFRLYSDIFWLPWGTWKCWKPASASHSPHPLSPFGHTQEYIAGPWPSLPISPHVCFNSSFANRYIMILPQDDQIAQMRSFAQSLVSFLLGCPGNLCSCIDVWPRGQGEVFSDVGG